MRRPRIAIGLAGALSIVAAAGGLAGAQESLPLRGGVAEENRSDEILDLTLWDAIQRGLRRNLALILSLEGVSEASGARTTARSELLPQLHAGVSWVNQKVNLEAFGFTGLPGFPEFQSVIGPFNVFDARAYASQTILDFDALAKKRAAERKLEAREHDLTSVRDEVVLASASLYLRVLAAESRVVAARAQLDTADALRELALHRNQTGLSPGIDLLRARVQAEEQRQRVIVAENDAQKEKLALARAIGLPLGQEYRLTDEMPFAPPPSLALDDAVARAYALRADLKAAEARVAAAEDEERAARGARLPTLGVAADFGAIGQTVGGSRATYSVSAGVSVPLFEGGRLSGELAEAQSKLRQWRALRDDLRARIYYEVRIALGDVEAAHQRVVVADEALELARRQLEQAKDRFEAGVSGNIDVVQAQESVARATEDRIESLLAYNSAKAELVRALGTAERDFASLLGVENP